MTAQQTRVPPKPISCASAGHDLDPGHSPHETQNWCAGADTSPSTRTANPLAAPIRQTPFGWMELRIWTEMWNDAQQARIAATNRAERGGVDPDIYADYLESLHRAEHQSLLSMRACYRRITPEPIKQWQQQTVGIGIDRLAKLLGYLGDPVIAQPHHWEGTGTNRELIADRPYRRTVSQLWQYCGHGAPQRKRRGMTADELAAHGNPKLKVQVYLAAVECMKQRRSPYRAIYDATKLAAHDKQHTTECVRCGPSGKPAQPGTDWSDGHKHAHALRIVGKTILKDLWIVAGGDDL